MFKIGYRAIYQKDICSAIEEAKRNGFEVLEIHLTSPQFMPMRYTQKQIKVIRDFADKNDVILQIHAPLEQSLIFTNTDLRKGAKKQLEEMVQFSKSLGARCLTLHPGKAAVYHTSTGEKLKDDDLYAAFYAELFEDSLKHIVKISRSNLYICVENTDNFTSEYQKILDKYLPSGKIFITWDIRKNYTYTTNELIEEQWRFVQKNKNHVKNLHISGFEGAHGELGGWEDKLTCFFDLFSDQDLSMVVEIMPIESAKKAAEVINKIVDNFKDAFYSKTLDYWQKRATNYLEELKPEITKEIIKYFKRNRAKYIADVGCGPAYYSGRLAKELDCCIMCMDFSAKMIENAKKFINEQNLINKFEFVQGSIVNIDFPNKKFDGIMFISLLHHLLSDDIKKTCQKAYKSLSNRGSIFIVEYWTKDKLNETEQKMLELSNQNRTNAGFKATLLRDKDYVNILRRIGFHDVRCKYIRDKFFSGKYSETQQDELIEVAVISARK